MKETGFRKIWKTLLPFIVTARPMTDNIGIAVRLPTRRIPRGGARKQRDIYTSGRGFSCFYVTPAATAHLVYS